MTQSSKKVGRMLWLVRAKLQMDCDNYAFEKQMHIQSQLDQTKIVFDNQGKNALQFQYEWLKYIFFRSKTKLAPETLTPFL
jgi:hypothetical protein